MSNEEIAEKEFKIPIKELFPRFEEHLEIKNNSRIWVFLVKWYKLK